MAVAEFLGVSGGRKLGEDLEPHRGQTRLWEGRADVIRATSWEHGRRERPGRKREAARLTDAAAAGRMLGLESGRRIFRDTSGVSRSGTCPRLVAKGSQRWPWRPGESPPQNMLLEC